MEREITYNIDPGSQVLIDKKGNTVIQLAKLSWNNGPYKLDLRKWAFKGEELIPQKGLSFLTDKGPHTLAEVLVSQGYGDTQVLKSYLATRVEPEKPKDDKPVYKKNALLEFIKKEESK